MSIEKVRTTVPELRRLLQTMHETPALPGMDPRHRTFAISVLEAAISEIEDLREHLESSYRTVSHTMDGVAMIIEQLDTANRLPGRADEARALARRFEAQAAEIKRVGEEDA